jgi:hypothetical protein
VYKSPWPKGSCFSQAESRVIIHPLLLALEYFHKNEIGSSRVEPDAALQARHNQRDSEQTNSPAVFKVQWLSCRDLLLICGRQLAAAKPFSPQSQSHVYFMYIVTSRCPADLLVA